LKAGPSGAVAYALSEALCTAALRNWVLSFDSQHHFKACSHFHKLTRCSSSREKYVAAFASGLTATACA